VVKVVLELGCSVCRLAGEELYGFERRLGCVGVVGE